MLGLLHPSLDPRVVEEAQDLTEVDAPVIQDPDESLPLMIGQKLGFGGYEKLRSAWARRCTYNMLRPGSKKVKGYGDLP